MEWPLKKSQGDRHGRDESSLREHVFGDDLSYPEDSSGQGSGFTLDTPLAPDSVCYGSGTRCQSFDLDRKRGEPVAVFNLI
jgi:hypothetical protein